MALDRTWYNSLVDDDGSGLTGSVWDKADVDSLMDAVDAEIARLDTARANLGVWSTHVPTLFTGAGTIVGGSQAAWYVRNNKAVTLVWNLSGFQVSAATPYLGIFVPITASAVATSWGSIAQLFVNNAVGQTFCPMEIASNLIQIAFNAPTGPLPGGFPANTAIYLRGQITYMID